MGWFHVYTQAPRLEPFAADPEKVRILTLIKQAERTFGLKVLACVVMSTHFHLVVEGRHEDLSRAIQWIKSVYARDYNRRHERFGAVWAERFACRVIQSEAHLARVCAYVRGNPVAAGLCKDIAAYRWAYGTWGVDVAIYERTSL